MSPRGGTDRDAGQRDGLVQRRRERAAGGLAFAVAAEYLLMGAQHAAIQQQEADELSGRRKAAQAPCDR